MNVSLEKFRLQYKIRNELHICLGQMTFPDCLRVLFTGQNCENTRRASPYSMRTCKTPVGMLPQHCMRVSLYRALVVVPCGGPKKSPRTFI